MHKSMIYVALGSLLVAGIFSSSTLFVFADSQTYCRGTSKTTAHCTTFNDQGDNPVFEMDCTYHATTKKWSCVESNQAPQTNTDIGNLKDAINSVNK